MVCNISLHNKQHVAPTIARIYFDFANKQTIQVLVCNSPLHNKQHVANHLLHEYILPLQISNQTLTHLQYPIAKQTNGCKHTVARTTIYLQFFTNPLITVAIVNQNSKQHLCNIMLQKQLLVCT